MGIWKLGFWGLLCAAFVFSVDAVELRRNQPTERIAGRFFVDLVIYC